MTDSQTFTLSSRSSAEIKWAQWDPGDEEFVFLSKGFDVNLARQILDQTPRPIVNLEYRTFLGLLQVIGVEEDQIAKVNLDIPIILAMGRDEQNDFWWMVIDGWHRIARAAQLGLNTLPAVILSPAETEIILFEVQRPCKSALSRK